MIKILILNQIIEKFNSYLDKLLRKELLFLRSLDWTLKKKRQSFRCSLKYQLRELLTLRALSVHRMLLVSL